MKEEEDDDERKKRSTPLRCLARSLARAGLKIRTFSHRPSASAAVPLSSSAAAFERKLLQDEMWSASLAPSPTSPTQPPSTFGLVESWPPSVRPSPIASASLCSLQLLFCMRHMRLTPVAAHALRGSLRAEGEEERRTDAGQTVCRGVGHSVHPP